MERFDAIVVGGGPGGSTAAALMAMDGRRVLLLERDTFPRYQIGESLLPVTIHGICNLLGIRESVAEAGFVRKLGGTFLWGRTKKPWTFAFAGPPELEQDTSTTYQVERSRFDQILLDHARTTGVDVRQGCTVTDAIDDGDRIAAVRFADTEGREHTAQGRYVIDASGVRSRIAARVGERVYSKFFQNVAVYGYYENGQRLDPPDDGNVLSVAFGSGWFWYIPLSDTLTSVGAVIGRQEAARLRGGHDEAMAAFIAECPMIRDLLSDARPVTGGPYGTLRVQRDYSYCQSRFWAPGAALIGDSACFVDPVFSSGVHLATYAGLQVARAVNTTLGGDLPEARCFDEFERRYRWEYGNFYQFLIAFYDMHVDPESHFWSSRKILNTEEARNEPLARLLAAGDAGNTAASDASQFFAARAGMGELLQRSMERVADPMAGLPFDTAVFDPRHLMVNLKREMRELTFLGVQGAKRPPDEPLTAGGLVPSANGLRWQTAL